MCFNLDITRSAANKHYLPAVDQEVYDTNSTDIRRVAPGIFAIVYCISVSALLWGELARAVVINNASLSGME